MTREDLTDTISDALGDSMDVDWNYSTGARYVIDALVKEGVITLPDQAAPLDLAWRAVDACGGTYTPEEKASGWAEGHHTALTDACAAIEKLGGRPN